MRVLLLGSQSFLDTQSKVGIQYIAEGLAKNGCEVDYVANGSSILDLFSKTRRPRFKRAWLRGNDASGVRISRNLTEYGPKSPFPTRKEILRHKWQIKAYPVFMPRALSGRVYDVCIHDSSNTFLFLPRIRARHFIYRLNDLPSGFSFAIHSNVIKTFDRMVESGRYDEIWAVSAPLAEYAARLNAENLVMTMPNGVDPGLYRNTRLVERRPLTAVFVGNIFPWIDLRLVNETAKLLPEWRLDFYGPLHTKWEIEASNISYNGVLERERLSETLSRYSVGLIPFKDISERMRVVERPLKFFEYLMAGLGVASTDVGSLRAGMGEWAAYGRTPEEYSSAIVEASERASRRKDNGELGEFIRVHSWDNIVNAMLERLESLLREKRAGVGRMDFRQ